jgi:hypothetical protein
MECSNQPYEHRCCWLDLDPLSYPRLRFGRLVGRNCHYHCDLREAGTTSDDFGDNTYLWAMDVEAVYGADGGVKYNC